MVEDVEIRDEVLRQDCQIPFVCLLTWTHTREKVDVLQQARGQRHEIAI